MTDSGLKISILDRSPVNGAESATEAFQHTIELAQQAERWGFHRFWVSEHHGSDRVMGSSPEVLISHILAKTEHIRVGSGGVMLQHYSPYKVAENFNVLASLAPGRIDLGIGRGPGGLPRSTRALQQHGEPESLPFAEKILEVQRFLWDQLEEGHPLYGLKASPVPAQPAEIYLLGTTAASAKMAADLGLPYVFALFLNSDEAEMARAFSTYRCHFNVEQGLLPRTMLALPVVLCDTDAEAEAQASAIQVVRMTLESGRTFTLATLQGAEEFGKQSGEKYTVDVRQASGLYGSLATARSNLSEMQGEYHFDELIAVTAIPDFSKQLRSFELLSQLVPSKP